MPQPPLADRHVFVYGTLRAGGSNDIARYHPRPQRVGDGVIAGTLYDLGPYPGAVLGGEGRIVGEVYRVTQDVEVELDLLEGVMADGSGEYLKRELDVMVGAARLRCLVYEIHPSRIEGRRSIDSGDWLIR
ncbi:gamma-glutamylcyclotransferase family protein [Variovorax robiniae]|uniref:Gamma-glutamylcyclotransferase family protein n=1 Tax=Variovorax robiniae TaxID=1836199 RepID=A0ABU8X3N6_9BURK